MSYRVFAFLFLCISLIAGTCVKEDPACERGYNDGCDTATTNDPIVDFVDGTYEDCYLQGYEDCSEAEYDMAAPTEPLDSEEETNATGFATLGR